MKQSENPNSDWGMLGFSTEHLRKLSSWQMPYGKYSGFRLIDLPEEYLFWFRNKGFPEGELGMLMAFCLDLKIAGLDGLLKTSSPDPADV